MIERAPHGTWRSPITAASIVGGAATITEVVVDGDRDDAPVWFAETRPSERGRTAVLRIDAGGSTTEVTPPEASVRSRVHEYGGGAWWVQHDAVYYVEQADQQLRMLRPGSGEPELLTRDERDRYADLRVSRDSAWVLAVRERHEPGAHEPANELVAVPTDASGAVRVLVSGPDFVSSPRLSPDGHRLAWIQWFHPNMPWDHTELWVAAFTDGRLSGARCLLRDAALVQPEWSPDGALHVLSDERGWWRVLRVDDHVELTSGERDWGEAPWVFGESMYAFAADGALVTLADVEPVLTEITCIRTRGTRTVAAGATWGSETQVVQLDRAGTVTTLRAPRDLGVDAAFFPPPERITFPTGDSDGAGEVAHAWFYPPANPGFAGPDGERPPLLVMAHGGPTTMAQTSLRLPTRYWTSRGFAVVDVDYRGSTGLGRAYRRALDGRWGIADVEDCVAAARFLAARGDVDGGRVCIRGGSAGGLTVLGALLAAPDLFAAATALYAVSDLEALARDTHKFEARYLDTLVAPYPQALEVYAARSPIGRVDELRTPLLVLHGRDDPVVPVAQSELLVAALAANGVPHRLVIFDGEGHGLRRADSQVAALEAELAFYVEHLRLGR